MQVPFLLAGSQISFALGLTVPYSLASSDKEAILDNQALPSSLSDSIFVTFSNSVFSRCILEFSNEKELSAV